MVSKISRELARERKRQYREKYREQDRAKQKEYSASYYLLNKEKIKSKNLTRYYTKYDNITIPLDIVKCNNTFCKNCTHKNPKLNLE